MKKQNASMVTDLTQGSVPKLLMKFSLPLLLSNALQAVYNLVDMVVVGQCIGGAGMSAVSIGGDVLALLTFVAMGFSGAGQVLIAQDVGAGRMESVKRTIGALFTLMLGVSLVISVVCFALRDVILSLLNTPSEALAYTMDYTVTCIAGLIFIYGYNVVSAILRGMGDSRRPFVFIAVAAILNMVLDVLFVKYMGMAVFGAALATVIGQGVSFVMSLVYLYMHKGAFGFDFKPRSFLIDRETLKRLMALGIPMTIQSAAVHLSKLVLTAWINLSGVVYSALLGIYNKINMMINIVSNSFTTAGSSMVGQNLGAGRTDRVPVILRTVLICGLIVAAAFSLVTLLIPDTLFAMFTGDQAVLAEASLLIMPMIFNYLGAATRAMAFALINGSGNTKLNLAVALIDGIISRIGIAALMGFALAMGCQGFLYGDALAGLVPFFIGATYFLSGRWKKAAKRAA